MTLNNNIIAIIPARGGSKGLPRKNILPLSGKPLIAHSIEHCTSSKYIQEVYVSTDEEEIVTVSKKHGASVILRPAELCQDESSSELAIEHALEVLSERNGTLPDLIVFIQCTSPVRGNNDLDQAIEQFVKEKADSLLSVSPSHAFLWRRSPGGPEPINYNPEHRPRRQDKEQNYWENGSFYIFSPQNFLKHKNRLGDRVSMYVMSRRVIDIDDELDFKIAELLLSHVTL